MAVTAIHPGEHLAEELEALDMSVAELARKSDVPGSVQTFSHIRLRHRAWWCSAPPRGSRKFFRERSCRCARCR